MNRVLPHELVNAVGRNCFFPIASAIAEWTKQRTGVILAVSGFGQVFSYQIAGNAVKRDIARLFALPRHL